MWNYSRTFGLYSANHPPLSSLNPLSHAVYLLNSLLRLTLNPHHLRRLSNTLLGFFFTLLSLQLLSLPQTVILIFSFVFCFFEKGAFIFLSFSASPVQSRKERLLGQFSRGAVI